MEFLPLEKYSQGKKRKKFLAGPKGKLDTGVNKKLKKSRNDEVKKLPSPEPDDIDQGNQSVVELSSNQISPEVKKISEDESNQKIPRLFVNMKRVIMNEEMVKEIHSDIIGVRLPRKKRSRWCWAIFHNEKKAAKALTELKKRNDIIVTKPQDQSKGELKKKTKSSDSKLKKLMKSKLKEAWM